MSARKLIYTGLFEADLDAVAAFLRQEAGVRTAEKWVAVIRRAARALADTPEAGAADPMLGGEGRRRLVVRPYLIIYELRPDHVRVLRVLHGARDLPGLLGG